MEPSTRKKDYRIFATVCIVVGFSTLLIEAIINNYYDTFHLTPVMRGWLEMPREVPGMLLVFISGALLFLGNVRMAMIANVVGAMGLIGLGFLTGSYSSMIPWLLLYTTGPHMWLALKDSISISLSKKGKEGKSLGFFNGIYTAGGLAGSLLVFIGFRYLGMGFKASFAIAAAVFLLGSILLVPLLKVETHKRRRFHLVFRKEYRLYYLLCILYGARKQVFLTFAPWVLIRVFGQPTEVFALTGFIGGAIGMVSMPLIGRWIDRYGERRILMTEAAILIAVCAGYGFTGDWMPSTIVLPAIFSCYMIDKIIMGVGMARTTYVRKIAVDPTDITPTLSLGISADHVVSMTIPVLGGYIWDAFGYQWVFIGGAVIALVNLFVASRIRVPAHNDTTALSA